MDHCDHECGLQEHLPVSIAATRCEPSCWFVDDDLLCINQFGSASDDCSLLMEETMLCIVYEEMVELLY